MNALAVGLIKEFEQLHDLRADGLVYPYVCPAGFPTIGWGRRVSTMQHPPVPRRLADLWLMEDVATAEAAVWRLCPGLMAESQARQAAILDFVYNLGAGRLQTSTLRRRINEQRWADVAYEVRRWVYGGGKVLPGLVRRRNAEAALVL